MSSPASSSTDRPAGLAAAADLLSIGFGTTVAMWSLAYLGNMPGLAPLLPPWLLPILLILTLFGGSFMAGKFTRRGWLGGLWSALISALLNLLILGSLRDELAAEGAPHAALWTAGFLLLSAAAGVIGGALGRTRRDTRRAEPDWVNIFSWVAVWATLLLIAKGGVVTSIGDKAAMSVPDWPQTFSTNMFLFPLSKMAGYVYFEHAHRLFATLVGLTTIMLALLLSLSPQRNLTRIVGWLALLLVVLQGVLGGVRVTLSETHLAMLHGILAQLFIGVLAAVTVLSSTLYKSDRAPKTIASAGADQTAAVIAVVLLVCQLFLGAIVRHLHPGPGIVMLHIAVGTVVLGAGITAGVRAWGLHPDITALHKGGKSLMHLVGTQFLLGFGAWATGVTHIANNALPENVWQIVVPTLHQACGALVLVYAVRLWVWTARLLASVHNGASQQAA